MTNWRMSGKSFPKKGEIKVFCNGALVVCVCWLGFNVSKKQRPFLSGLLDLMRSSLRICGLRLLARCQTEVRTGGKKEAWTRLTETGTSAVTKTAKG